MRRSMMLAFVLFGGAWLAPAAVAQEDPRAFGPVPSGVWRLELDEELDGRVRPNSQAGLLRLRVIRDRLYGQPADDDPDRARLAGQIMEGRSTVVTWRQDNANVEGYSQFCTGRVVRFGVIAGTWYDTTGKSGDFVLSLAQRPGLSPLPQR